MDVDNRPAGVHGPAETEDKITPIDWPFQVEATPIYDGQGQELGQMDTFLPDIIKAILERARRRYGSSITIVWPYRYPYHNFARSERDYLALSHDEKRSMCAEIQACLIGILEKIKVGIVLGGADAVAVATPDWAPNPDEPPKIVFTTYILDRLTLARSYMEQIHIILYVYIACFHELANVMVKFVHGIEAQAPLPHTWSPAFELAEDKMAAMADAVEHKDGGAIADACIAGLTVELTGQQMIPDPIFGSRLQTVLGLVDDLQARRELSRLLPGSPSSSCFPILAAGSIRHTDYWWSEELSEWIIPMAIHRPRPISQLLGLPVKPGLLSSMALFDRCGSAGTAGASDTSLRSGMLISPLGIGTGLSEALACKIAKEQAGEISRLRLATPPPFVPSVWRCLVPMPMPESTSPPENPQQDC